MDAFLNLLIKQFNGARSLLQDAAAQSEKFHLPAYMRPYHHPRA